MYISREQRIQLEGWAVHKLVNARAPLTAEFVGTEVRKTTKREKLKRWKSKLWWYGKQCLNQFFNMNDTWRMN